jgi:hypothetical protein
VGLLISLYLGILAYHKEVYKEFWGVLVLLSNPDNYIIAMSKPNKSLSNEGAHRIMEFEIPVYFYSSESVISKGLIYSVNEVTCFTSLIMNVLCSLNFNIAVLKGHPAQIEISLCCSFDWL